MARMRTRYILLGAVVCLLVGFGVVQCTPVVGCWGERVHYSGRGLGFLVGMDRAVAAEKVAAAYDTRDVSVWTGDGGDSVSVRTVSQLKALTQPYQQWRFENRSRPYCSAKRNVVLVFRGDRLVSIKDELSITLP